MRWLSRLVTFGIVISVIGVVVLLLRARIPNQRIGDSFTTYAKFRDGSHLAVGSPVVIAGVRIGDITKISIEGRFARVDMRLQDGAQIPADAFVTRRADSLLGDSYIEVIFSGADDGAAPARMLASGEPIAHVIEGASTDAVLRAMDRSMPRIENALEVVHEVLGKGRKAINGDIVESMQGADSWLAAGKIEGPLSKTRGAFERIDRLTEAGAGALAQIAPDTIKAFDRIDTAVARARTGIHDAKGQLITALQDTRAGLDGADTQIDQVSEVLGAINEGRGTDWKGTLGRLINDPDVADSLEDAVAAGEDAVASYNQFKSYLGMRLEWNLNAGRPRLYATAEIRARTDKFYLVELESGSLGGVPSDGLTDAANTSQYTRRQEIKDTLRFTAQFGKQLGNFALRAGVKDSTFGAGADLLLMRGRLRFSTDVFGSFQRTPRVKVAAAFAVFKSIYVLAGVDDALNSPGYLRINSGNTSVPTALTEVHYGRDYFLGATIYLDEADLATLLRVYGALLVGALAR
ncbi:MAG: MCE family protein [Myxococcales bacterium]|nr:MCE family protein [Myxococcales bacterium]